MSTSTDSMEQTAGNGMRPVLGGLATLVATGAAVAAALVSGSGTGRVVGGIDTLAQTLASLLEAVATALPLGYAFGAGMVAAVNPCGFALLPAYLALYLGTTNEVTTQRPTRGRALRALQVSAAVSAGFVLLFGGAGLLISLATSTIVGMLPWAGLGIGILLAVGGGWMLAGGTFSTYLADQVADRVGASAYRSDSRGFFLYGLTYGIASLGCTLPIFLTVVGSTLAVNGLLAATGQFVLYALGMATVITLLTLSTMFVQMTALLKVRRLGRSMRTISTVLLLLAGAYLIYYWLTLGGLLAVMGFA